MQLYIGRVVAALTAVAGLITAVVPALANVDASSSVTIATGFLGVAAVVVKWLDGLQKHEARQDTGEAPDGVADDEPGDDDALPEVKPADPVAVPSDEGDLGSAS